MPQLLDLVAEPSRLLELEVAGVLVHLGLELLDPFHGLLRRKRQGEYNAEHGITPTSIVKSIDDVLSSVYDRDYSSVTDPRERGPVFRTHAELESHITTLDEQMKAAAANLDFEKAASLRDQIRGFRSRDLGLGPFDSAQGGPAAPA